ncbi:hypothetical protein T07_8420 [Trichinella nelsoni]|uniref:Uncharacterized protein n=1 Tax=Trichinella nelsoni TaxID=6336 RepID=A0A0V0RGM6_9BILA|nr:hypothetical protein T07_8420 [Trichinella nelsoni]
MQLFQYDNLICSIGNDEGATVDLVSYLQSFEENERILKNANCKLNSIRLFDRENKKFSVEEWNLRKSYIHPHPARTPCLLAVSTLVPVGCE